MTSVVQRIADRVAVAAQVASGLSTTEFRLAAGASLTRKDSNGSWFVIVVLDYTKLARCCEAEDDVLLVEYLAEQLCRGRDKKGCV